MWIRMFWNYGHNKPINKLIPRPRYDNDKILIFFCKNSNLGDCLTPQLKLPPNGRHGYTSTPPQFPCNARPSPCDRMLKGLAGRNHLKMMNPQKKSAYEA